MHDPPPLPEGFHLIAAYGVLLAVPDQWNPVLLRGSAPGPIKRWMNRDPAPRGIIALADLRGTPLELRWRTFASPAHATRQLEKLTKPIERSGALLQRQGDAILIPSQAPTSATRVLLTSNKRLYELTLTQSKQTVIDWFLRANTEPGEPQDYLWSLYGFHGLAPRDARVQKLVLQPGNAQIVLVSPGTRIALGAFSLADRLLTNNPLLTWAKSLRKEGRAVGQWQLDDQSISFTGTELRRFCRRIHHEMHFRHDPAHNRIAWEHRQQWGSTASIAIIPQDATAIR